MGVQYQSFVACQPIGSAASATMAAGLSLSSSASVIASATLNVSIAAGLALQSAASIILSGAANTSIAAGLTLDSAAMVRTPNAATLNSSIAAGIAVGSNGQGQIIVRGTANDTIAAGLTLASAGTVAAGTPTPGTTCANAATLSVPSTYSYSLTGFGTNQTFKIAMNNGTQYKWTVHLTSGTYGGTSWTHGACPGTTITPAPSSLTECANYTATANEDLNMQVSAPFTGTFNYTLTIATGACP